MDPKVQAAVNGVVGFVLVAGLYVVLGNDPLTAVALGAAAGVGFAIGVYLFER